MVHPHTPLVNPSAPRNLARIRQLDRSVRSMSWLGLLLLAGDVQRRPTRRSTGSAARQLGRGRGLPDPGHTPGHTLDVLPCPASAGATLGGRLDLRKRERQDFAGRFRTCLIALSRWRHGSNPVGTTNIDPRLARYLRARPSRTSVARWASRSRSSPRSAWSATRAVRARCPDPSRGTTACPGPRPRGR